MINGSKFFFTTTYLLQLILICSLSFCSSIAQNNELILGHWELQSVTFKKIKSDSKENNLEDLTNLYKLALLQTLSYEQQRKVDELDIINAQAEEIAKTFFQSSIEFQSNQAFYNTSKVSISGEYILDSKKLLLDWSNAEKNNFKIIKITDNELVVKDNDLKIEYTYKKLNPEEVAEKAARLKKKKEEEKRCPIPDKTRIEAEKKEKEKFEQRSKMD